MECLLMDADVQQMLSSDMSCDMFSGNDDIFNIDTCYDALDDGFWESLTHSSPMSPASTDSDPFDTELDLLSESESSSVDSCELSCETITPPANTLNAACDCTGLSVLSSCANSEVNPILRDCMWSATSGLIPFIVPLNSQSSGANCSESSDVNSAVRCLVGASGSNHFAGSCTICCSCVDQAAMCVDPKTVFPYPMVQARPTVSANYVTEEDCTTSVASTKFSCALAYDHDSETSAYSSAVSDDELEEVDVVSVVSCNYEISSRYSSPTSVSSDQSQSNVRRQMLVLPASESMSAQVAAMHNYSSTRCRPTPASSVSTNAITHSLITKRCAKRLVGKATSRKRRRAIVTPSSGSDSSEDSWTTGDVDDRCRRAQHNVMERRRRHHLKGNFFRLRDVIPEINGDSRVSKVAILCRARDYIGRLSSNEDKLRMEYDRLRAIQSRLKWKLSLLQRDQRLAVGVN